LSFFDFNSLDLLRLCFEISLTFAVLGLVFVAGGFLVLLGINIFELLTRKLLRTPKVGPHLTDAELPHVLVQIPLYNEAEMVADVLACAVALDWPRERLHIQLLDDSTDKTCHIARHLTASLRAQGFDILHLRRANRMGYKAGALAAGLARSDAPYIAVLDADFRPPADWLRMVIPTLAADPQAGFVQSRCEFSNYRTNWLTRAQGMMMDAHFTMEQATRYRAGWLFQFNGTGGVWRREAIVAAGGWSSDSLCEDLDLTVRAKVAGWHGIFQMEPAVPGLVPEQVNHWRVQQRRWSNGFVQVTRKMIKEVWQAQWSFGHKLSASFLILIQAFYPCAAIGAISLLICSLLRGGDLTAYLPLIIVLLSLIVIIAVGLTLVPYLTLRRGTLLDYLVTVTLLTPLMVYVSLSNAPSILLSLFQRREESKELWKRTPKSKVMNLPARSPVMLAVTAAIPPLNEQPRVFSNDVDELIAVQDNAIRQRSEAFS
jgi:cellulose synthase/poly-beta-1,6-N-acetylglucosamine synthase-like glycosyltransferase